jgi:hypothetical protein
MHHYHGTTEHANRLRDNRCRCKSTGVSYNLAAFVAEGIIVDPRNPTIPLTSGEIGVPDKTNVFIYAVSEEFCIQIAPDGDRGQPDAVKHETLFHNAPVRAAGELHIVNGRLVAINDVSGSYGTRGYLETDPSFAASLLVVIRQHQIPIESTLHAALVAWGSEG